MTFKNLKINSQDYKKSLYHVRFWYKKFIEQYKSKFKNNNYVYSFGKVQWDTGGSDVLDKYVVVINSSHFYICWFVK
jgi:hypothetical protein